MVPKVKTCCSVKEELDYFFKQIKTLDIPIKEITDMYREFCKKEK